MRILFMGTPDFAVASLKALVEAGHEICGVFTQPDKPKNRGHKLAFSPVKEYALTQNLPVYQPLKMRDGTALELVRELHPELIVVAAYGRILPEELLNTPPYGSINVHSSILPKYRGAAPINWAIINGENMTGVTTFMIDAGVDTGKIMYREQCPIRPTDTAGTLHDKLMVLGADLVEQTVEALIEGSVEFRVQRSFIQGAEVLKGAPKITKEMCRIDWNKPSVQVCNFVRGMSPYPTAWTEISKEGENPLTMKVFFAERLSTEDYERLSSGRTVGPGQILSDGKGIFAVATADGAVALTDLQMAGKKRMDAKSFLLGFREPENYTVK